MSEAEAKALVDDWFAVWCELSERDHDLGPVTGPVVAAILVSSRRQSERE